MMVLIRPVCLLIISFVLLLQAFDPCVANPRTEWVINNPFRVTVTVTPVSGRNTHQSPVCVQLDFQALLRDAKVTGRLNPDSIRVVRFDPRSGRSLPYRESSLSYEVPYQLSRDFFYGDSGKIWWRLRDSEDRHFHVYFGTRDEGVKVKSDYIPAIGMGDNLRMNDGQPGMLDVAMHPALNFVDWDGDGKNDLLLSSGQTHEYGLERISQGYLYFYKNIGTQQKPAFGPGFQLKDSQGQYLNNERFFHFYYSLADWDNDGDLDIIHSAFGQKIYWYENSGKRDRDNLPILIDHTTPLFELPEGNDFISKNSYRRHPRLLDWDGDGDLDLFYSVHYETADKNTSNADAVILWSEVLQFFELHENLGKDSNGQTRWAKPKAVRENRGPIIATMGYQGADYVDWDGDGDLDLIAGDTNNHPMGLPRVLWFENRGTRSNPQFLTNQTLLTSVEDFATDPGTRAVDWDADGDLDLVLVGLEGFLKVCENISTEPKGIPRLAECRFVEQSQPLVTAAHHGKFRVVDWNGDGLNDIIEGSEIGNVRWLENVGTAIDPVFRPAVNLKADGKDLRLFNLLDSPQGPSERNAGYVTPAIADFDNDGDLDMFVGDMRGFQTYFENIGSRKQPQLAAGRLVTVNDQMRSFGWRNQVGLADIAGDGKIEIITTAFTNRQVSIYKPNDKQSDPTRLKAEQVVVLKLESGEPLVPFLTTANNNGDYLIDLDDWDNDGDLDLFIGSLYNLWYYENVGGRQQPVFRAHGKVMVEGKPLHISNHPFSVEVVDWNGDGKKDLLLGGESGWSYFFERSFLEGALPKVSNTIVEVRPR